MGSGNKSMIINSRERAVSTDINRLQAFAASDQAQALRRQYGMKATGSGPLFPGVEVDIAALPTGATEPVVHKVLQGLMARPDTASYLLVDAGTAMFYAPSFGGTDDSDWVVVDDPGVTDIATLTFTSNSGGGSTRIDLLECQPVETVLETSSRDQFDTTTGTFSAAVLNKVSAARLNYRIRTGTPGAGIPSISHSWMPIALIHTRTDATGFDNCDFYDVRPLVEPSLMSEHRMRPVYDTVSTYGSIIQLDPNNYVDCFTTTGPTTVKATGYFASALNGVKVGGYLMSGVAATSIGAFGTDKYYVDMADSTNFSSSDPPVNTPGSRNALGIFLPKMFNRFVRYSQTAVSLTKSDVNTRLPLGPNGVFFLVHSTSAMQRGDGVFAADFGFPSGMGFGSSAIASGVCVAETIANSSRSSQSNFMVKGREVWYPVRDGFGDTPLASMGFAGTYVGSTIRGTITFGVLRSNSGVWSSGYVPMDAKFITLSITGSITMAATTLVYDCSVSNSYVYKAGRGGYELPVSKCSVALTTGSTATYEVVVRVPLYLAATTNPDYANLLDSQATLTIEFNGLDSSGAYKNFTGVTGTATLIGYER